MFDSLIDALGNTPILSLSRFAPGVKLAAKIESRNPLFSVKCRTAWGMVREAEEHGLLKPWHLLDKNDGAINSIVEPTSGNTGIALAWIARIRGYRLLLTMPETMSLERRAILKFLGAELVLTPGDKGMSGAVEKAMELASETGFHFPNQFANAGNVRIHYETTGPEIFEQLEHNVDIAVFGVGTGGTLTGVSRYLKEKNPNLKVVAIEPASSPVLSGGSPGKHKIQGIGAGFVPAILDRSLIDSIELVTNEEAIATARELALTEGIFAGISSGAAAHVARRMAHNNPQKQVVTILPDTAERYLSTDLFKLEDNT